MVGCRVQEFKICWGPGVWQPSEETDGFACWRSVHLGGLGFVEGFRV